MYTHLLCWIKLVNDAKQTLTLRIQLEVIPKRCECVCIHVGCVHMFAVLWWCCSADVRNFEMAVKKIGLMCDWLYYRSIVFFVFFFFVCCSFVRLIYKTKRTNRMLYEKLCKILNSCLNSLSISYSHMNYLLWIIKYSVSYQSECVTNVFVFIEMTRLDLTDIIGSAIEMILNSRCPQTYYD